MTKRIFLLLAVLLALLPATASAAVESNRVYVLGDSYSFDMQGTTYSAGNTLQQSFSYAGMNAYVSGRGGRGIGGNPTPNGLQQVVKDRALIARSSKIVVELGTNTTPDGTYFASRAATLLKTVRSYQSTIKVYWVVPGNFVVSSSYQAALARNRQVILGLAGVTPIRWDISAQKSWFSSADGYKHPRVMSATTHRSIGYDALKQQIVDATR